MGLPDAKVPIRGPREAVRLWSATIYEHAAEQRLDRAGHLVQHLCEPTQYIGERDYSHRRENDEEHLYFD
jgi:hypothetical protein